MPQVEARAREDRGEDDEGEDADAAARWVIDYSPIRLSDTVPPIGTTGALSEAELAVARAETVNLGELMSRSGARIGTGPDAGWDGEEGDGPSAAELPGGREAVATAYGGGDDGYGGGYGDGDGDGDSDSYGRAGSEDGSDHYRDDYGDDGGALRASSPRPAPRLPAARPSTSKPGRVQVNPPGTHSGPTGSPPAAARAGTGGEPAPSEDPGNALDDVAPLVRRRAVGH
jgi:hypothetical protein